MVALQLWLIVSECKAEDCIHWRQQNASEALAPGRGDLPSALLLAPTLSNWKPLALTGPPSLGGNGRLGHVVSGP